MTSSRQIEANRLNAQLSTGPVSANGKQRSRRNALRHGLTAETIIDALEDAEDYASFEMAITADFEARRAVERELVLRLASVLWRLRRATAIESGLFRIQALHLLQLRRSQKKQIEVPEGQETGRLLCSDDIPLPDNTDQPDDLTQSFIRLSNLASCPLDRFSRYEATLWRQACQILFALQFMDRGTSPKAAKLRWR
jgi:hypothetical protein